MEKWKKIVFVCSLLLNVLTIAGFLGFRHYVRTTMFQVAAMTAQAETHQLKNILSDIDSNDPARIAALKERLHKSLEQCQKSSVVWQNAATK
jgi:hypothetical protein